MNRKSFVNAIHLNASPLNSVLLNIKYSLI